MQTKDVTIFIQMFGKCYSYSCSTMDAPNNTNQTYVLRLKTNGNLQKSNYGNFDQQSETKGAFKYLSVTKLHAPMISIKCRLRSAGCLFSMM